MWLRRKVINKLKNSLKYGDITYGAWMQIPHPAIVEIIAHNCNNKLDSL